MVNSVEDFKEAMKGARELLAENARNAVAEEYEDLGINNNINSLYKGDTTSSENSQENE